MKSSPFTSLTFNDKRISARANLTQVSDLDFEVEFIV